MAVVKEAVRVNPTAARILAAAADLFVARNYADVTVDQVAEAAEVTKGAVYHHFNSKQALYLAMLHHDLAEKRALHERAIDFDGSCVERLRALTGAFLALPPTQRRLIRLIRRDANIFRDPERTELVQAYQTALPDLIERVIRDGVRDGELIPCDPRLMAWQYIAVFEVLLTPYADQKFTTNEDKLNYVLSVFLNGCARTRDA
jgi:AcrR family transcriptional regulator